MRRMRGLAVLLALAALLLGAPEPARAADPGLLYPNSSPASDMRPGSVLFFPYYTSDPPSPDEDASPPAQDTRIAITNHSTASAAFLRLFFVNGSTGAVTSSNLCLTATQTSSFNLSAVQPGVTGYLVAVAVDGVLGCPVSLNTTGPSRPGITGEAHVRRADGFQGVLGAIAVQALFPSGLPGCFAGSTLATLTFNDVVYNRLPRTLALTNLPAAADAQTLLIVDRIGGSLATGPDPVGSLAGTLYDQDGNAFPYTLTSTSPQFVSALSDAVPATTPVFSATVPPGETGWTKLRNDTVDQGYVGAAFLKASGPGVAGAASPEAATRGRKAPVVPDGFSGAVNLRSREPSATNILVIPVQPPSC